MGLEIRSISSGSAAPAQAQYVSIDAILDLMERAEKQLAANSAQTLSTIQDAYSLAVGLPRDGNASGGLAPWQMRKVIKHIEENLTTGVRVSDLASLAKISGSHFARSFRVSFRETPYSYVLRRRMTLAQHMMVTTHKPLSEIAMDCGMSDQAHFTRIFRKCIGSTPNAWRRRAVGSASTAIAT